MYRFRKIEHLLGEFKELENQEIYFASPEELNDPMEGFRDIFWDGDEIVWKNFFKHYLRCVEYVYALNIVLEENKKVSEVDIKNAVSNLGFSQLKANFSKEIYGKVFHKKIVKEIITVLAKRITPIRRDELLSLLSIFHPFVLDVISQVYISNKLLSKPYLNNTTGNLEELLLYKKESLELINNRSSKDKSISMDMFFMVSSLVSQDYTLSRNYNIEDSVLSSNAFFLMTEFPEKYISALGVLLYPNWYAASFISHCDNSTMWGHYASNHTGVCLKFKTYADEDGNLTMSVGGKKGENQRKLHKVRYDSKHIEIDFFRSIATHAKGLIEHYWYTDENGNKSVCGEHLDNSIDEWRVGYWDRFTKSNTLKLKEWEYENEYRLALFDNLHQFHDKENRKLKYNFANLEAIVFGIKTSMVDKIKIIRIIEGKCNESNRKDFDFYQAYYSRESGKIETHKLTSIKFE